MNKQTIMLKITGELFLDPITKQFTRKYADSLAEQIKQLSNTYTFGIVIGGGAFFRGNKNIKNLALRPTTAHTIGMMATSMSSLLLYDIFNDHTLASVILNSFECTPVGYTVNVQTLDDAHAKNKIIIFGGGTGNPFVSTDTCAIIRAKQIGAQQVWKATTIDGVYSTDPRIDPSAKFIKKLNYQEALDNQLEFMDHTAIILAKQEQIVIRVFDIFAPNALINAAHDKNVGSTIQA